MNSFSEFENDVFISYAHIDNQALAEGESGWVANFHYALEVRLRQLLGANAKIWRDTNLQGHDYFNDALINKLPQVALCISILSPRYIQSEWCTREVAEFCKAARQHGGLRIGEKSRLFKVVKTYVPLEDQPAEMQKMLGYEFYQVDPATQRPREFRQEVGPNKDSRYWDILEDLAHDVAELLKIIISQQAVNDLGSGQGDNRQVAAPNQGSIYLASTTSDLKAEYDSIKREFQQRGYAILPDSPLPQSAPEFQELVRGYLENCVLSAHLIGQRYGLIPEAAERSVVDLQNKLAIERCQDPTFSRVIWLPVDLQPQEERQQEFVRYLQTDSQAQKGAELLQTDLGELKICIQNLLSADRKSTEEGLDEDEHPRVYVIYSAQDFDQVAALEDSLYEAGLEGLSPLFEGEEEVLEEHQENLLRCDAAIIYYGNAGERWFRTKWRDLERPDTRRSNPMRVKAVYLAAPEAPQKQRFQTHEASLIKNFAEFSPDDLQPFIAAVKQTRERQS